MFIMLVGAVFSHQVVYVYDNHAEENKLPLAGFIARLIGTIGRFLIFPYVCITFETYLLSDSVDDDMQTLADILWTLIAVYFGFIYPWEALLLYRHFDRTLAEIKTKIDDEGKPEHRDYTITVNEIYLFNLWNYGHFWNFSTDHHRKVIQRDYDDMMAQFEANKRSLGKTSSSCDDEENPNVVRRTNPIHKVVNAVALKSAMKKRTNNDGLGGTDEAFSAASVPGVTSNLEMMNNAGIEMSDTPPFNQGQLDPHQFERKTSEPNSDDEC